MREEQNGVSVDAMIGSGLCGFGYRKILSCLFFLPVLCVGGLIYFNRDKRLIPPVSSKKKKTRTFYLALYRQMTLVFTFNIQSGAHEHVTWSWQMCPLVGGPNVDEQRRRTQRRSKSP